MLPFLLFGITATGQAQDESAARTETVAGLDGPVEIIRDEWGIPTIRASTDHDLFVGFGYAMADDRLWQMDGSRRLARGRVGEIAGYEQIHWDIFHRKLGLGRVADESVPLLDSTTREYLQAFADGVNAYIAAHQSSLGFEFLLMGYEPEPWEVADSLAVARLVAVWLAADWWDEEMYGELVDSLGEEEASLLFRPVPLSEPDYSGLPASGGEADSLTFDILQPMNRPPACGGTTGGSTRDAGWKAGAPVAQWLEPLARLSRAGGIEASNIWAVDGSMTESGEPILAMDPHLNYFAPSILYEARLEGPSFNCWGATFPGMAALPFGANEHICWGASNLPADTQDLYIERLNPRNWREYEVDGEWVEFEIVRERIPFRTDEGEQQTLLQDVYISRHGPVVERRAGDCLVLRWTGAEPSDDVTGFFRAMRADSLETFYEAFRDYSCPPQNFICAETGPEGRVGQIIIGRIPVRAGYSGARPVDGSDSANDWIGFIPYDDLPHRLDPPEGFVAHANNLPLRSAGCQPAFGSVSTPSDAGWQPALLSDGGLVEGERPLGSSFSANHRVERIIECLVEGAPLTPEDMRTIQMDDLDPTAWVFIPALLDAWEGVETDYPELSDIITRLREWDYHLEERSIAATIYQLWLIELAQTCPIERLHDGLSAYLGFEDRWLPLLESYLAGESDLPWLAEDDRDTRDHEAVSALERVIDRLEAQFRPDPEDWAWGELHSAVFPHPSGIAMLIGGGRHPWGGGRYTIRVGHYDPYQGPPFENDFGAVFRAVAASVDGEWEIQAVLPPGQGGSVLGPHFTDQMQLWLDGELRPVPFGATALEPTYALRLEPG